MLDVLIIGAGLSGIGAARHLQARCPSKRWAILEARDDLGGTWDLFRYPGVRSDSDMYTLGYAFKPWTESKAIADGATILRYLREAADEADITSQIQFGQAVRQARWSTEEAAWTLDVETIKTGERSQFRTRFLYLCCGYYSYAEGHHPAFPDQDSFKGTLVYPQFWPADLDYAGKQVVVSGAGPRRQLWFRRWLKRRPMSRCSSARPRTWLQGLRTTRLHCGFTAICLGS
jgi:cyclohexanone monooxygenase